MIKGFKNINVLDMKTSDIFKNTIFIYRKEIYFFYKLLK